MFGNLKGLAGYLEKGLDIPGRGYILREYGKIITQEHWRYEMDAKRMKAAEFMIYSEGPVAMSVCTGLSEPEEVEARANMESPTGIDSKWQISKDPFRTGETNPCACNTNPDTHKHFLLEC